MMRSLVLGSLLVAITPCLYAQRMGFSSPHLGSGYGRAGHSRFGGTGSLLYPLAYSGSLFSDYLSTPDYSVAPPPYIIVQAPAAAAPYPDPSAPSQPLTIELRGDRYVRLREGESSQTEISQAESETIKSAPRASDCETRNRTDRDEMSRTLDRAVEDRQFVPAVLTFRDGHREEVSTYTISDGVLYARSDFYTTGSWDRKIYLSSLNLPETIQSNQSRGVKFRLPSAPNEVIVGP